MSAPTPGPWEADSASKPTKKGTRWFFHIVANDGATVVAEADGSHDDRQTLVSLPREENAANARLIASAPDLLAALKELARLSATEGRQPVMDALRVAQDVIATAEGRR